MANAGPADGVESTGGDWSLPESSRTGRVCLRVTDLDRLTAFYRDVVGLSVLSTADADDGRATLGVDGRPLLELRGDPGAPERGPTEAGLFHTAFRVPTRGALADALARVQDGWRLTGASDHHVSEALYLRDPEGNGVEIYRDRPRDEWPVGPDGRVQMDSLPLNLDDLAAKATGGDAAADDDAPTGPATVPPGTDVGHVHLEVTDLDAARAFYVDALGLNLRQRREDSALFLAAGDYHHHVGLNVWNGRSAPRSGRGLTWFELLVPAGTLGDLRERLADATAVETRPDGTLAVEAPDGIELRVAAEPT